MFRHCYINFNYKQFAVKKAGHLTMKTKNFDFEARFLIGWLANTLRVFANQNAVIKVKHFCFHAKMAYLSYCEYSSTVFLTYRSSKCCNGESILTFLLHYLRCNIKTSEHVIYNEPRLLGDGSNITYHCMDNYLTLNATTYVTVKCSDPPKNLTLGGCYGMLY